MWQFLKIYNYGFIIHDNNWQLIIAKNMDRVRLFIPLNIYFWIILVWILPFLML